MTLFAISSIRTKTISPDTLGWLQSSGSDGNEKPGWWVLELKPSTQAKSMPEFSLQREVLGWLIAPRSGHGDFADYHERFGHGEQDLHWQCGRKRIQLHPSLCPKLSPQRGKLLCKKLGRQLSSKEVLGTPERVTIFTE